MEKILSIAIYLLVFLACLIFTSRAENAIEYGKKKNYYLYSVVALCIPCLLAGLRGIEVGTDTIRYEIMYQAAIDSSSWKHYFASMKLQGLEIGYSMFLYLLAQLRVSFNMMFFIVELITILPVYYVATKKRNYAPMATYMAVFLCLFYNISFNATRQCVALSFILISYYFLSEGKYVRGILFSILAISFHSSAYIGIVFIIASLIFMKMRIEAFRQLGLIATFCVLALLPMYFDKLASLLASVGFISNRQSFYRLVFSGAANIAGGTSLGNNGYYSVFMRALFFIIPTFYICNKRQLKDGYIRSIFLVVFIGVLFYCSTAIAFNTIHVYRITLYAEMFFVLYLPLAYSKSLGEVNKNESIYMGNRSRVRSYNIKLRNFIFNFCIWSYWFITFMHYNYHQTSNYFML